MTSINLNFKGRVQITNQGGETNLVFWGDNINQNLKLISTLVHSGEWIAHITRVIGGFEVERYFNVQNIDWFFDPDNLLNLRWEYEPAEGVNRAWAFCPIEEGEEHSRGVGSYVRVVSLTPRPDTEEPLRVWGPAAGW